MTENYKFLFVPIDGVGPFQACCGIASILRDRGHSVTFAATSSWKGKLSAQGFGEEIYHVAEDEETRIKLAQGALWGEMIRNAAPFFSLDSMELLEKFYLPAWKIDLEQIRYYTPRMKNIINTVKPDIVISDNIFQSPAIMNSGIPWISLISITPLGISNENVPPAYAGYPTSIKDKTLWETFNSKLIMVLKNIINEQNKWHLENESTEVELRFPCFYDWSPYGNIYMYPKELEYISFRLNPPTFHQFDCFLKIVDEKFQIPDKLKTGLGKLIYFSMGTIGCIEVNLMKRLIVILRKSPNRFIVSKGARGNEIELGDNMWGANSVPQTSVIPLVDLVITHGGNNTVTETFYFGKRLLVMPLIFDQLDNAQRIYETGHGLKFHPYKVTEQELLAGVEPLLADNLLERRMISISRRIQAEVPQQKAADLIEKIVFGIKSKRVASCVR